VTRFGQVEEALQIIAPPPPQREHCKQQINFALDCIQAEDDDPETAMLASARSQRVKRAWRSYHLAVKRLYQADAKLRATGWGSGALIDSKSIERAINISTPVISSRRARGEPRNHFAEYADSWRHHKEKMAVSWAYTLLSSFGGRASTTQEGQWKRLAAILFGNPRANLRRHIVRHNADRKKSPRI
jgi:hypothetical protein